MRISFLITLLVAAGLFASVAALFLFPQAFGLNPTPAPQVKTSGKALIGEPFSLIDHKGQRVSEKSYAGKFLLIYFGYTSCFDMCPAQLQVMSAALDTLGDKAKRIQPLLISIDPERDSIAAMADYVASYGDGLVGLTGTVEEIEAVTKAYRIFYAKEKVDDLSKNYRVAHAGIIYLMDKKGGFIKHFAFGVRPDELAAELEKLL